MSDDPIHLWFGLSHAQYLTVPRSVLQSIPAEWQEKFVALLDEMESKIDSSVSGTYHVELRELNDTGTGNLRWGNKLNDPFADYERGRRRIPYRSMVEYPK